MNLTNDEHAHVQGFIRFCTRCRSTYSMGQTPCCEQEGVVLHSSAVSLYRAGQDMLTLFETWRDGIFTDIGVKWVVEPPAVIAMRKALEKKDMR